MDDLLESILRTFYKQNLTTRFYEGIKCEVSQVQQLRSILRQLLLEDFQTTQLALLQTLWLPSRYE